MCFFLNTNEYVYYCIKQIEVSNLQELANASTTKIRRYINGKIYDTDVQIAKANNLFFYLMEVTIEGQWSGKVKVSLKLVRESIQIRNLRAKNIEANMGHGYSQLISIELERTSAVCSLL